MIFLPLNNYLSLEMIETEEGAVLLPDNAKKEGRWAKVLATGPGVPDMKGGLVTSLLAPGDTAYVMAHGREIAHLREAGFEKDVSTASELDVMCTAEISEEKGEKKVILRPLGMYIEIEKVEAPEKDILVPDSKAVPSSVGIVKSLGYGWKDIFGNTIDHQVKVGDKVIFDPYRALVLDMEPLGLNEKRYLVLHGDIWGHVVEV